MVRLGATFPQTEIGADPRVVREWALAVEEMGYDFIMAYDHVLGARAGHPALGGQRMPYTDQSAFHEPMVLYGYLAACTRRLELVTGIIILPQRQTALVAKQAAAIDILSGGRLRLGVGLGWNPVEYEALGQNFHDRGRRVEEQVEVLRLLWTEPLVTYRGKWHTITDAGINPLPGHLIPIWMGGSDERVLDRIGRIADGWVAMGRADSQAERLERIRESARRAARDPGSLSVVGAVGLRDASGPDAWLRAAEGWAQAGATHITVNALNAGFPSIAAQLEALYQVRGTLRGHL